MPDKRTIAYYDEQAEQLAENYHAGDVTALHARLMEAFSQCSRLLDLGCGSGREMAALFKCGFDVRGVDASVAMLNAARAWYPELEGRLYQASLPDRIQFPDRSFDGVLALAVVMHLAPSAIVETFREVSRLLRPGGVFFLSVPISRHDVGTDSRAPEGRLFTMLPTAEWQNLLCQAGFETSDTNTDSDMLNRSGVRWLSLIARHPQTKHSGAAATPV